MKRLRSGMSVSPTMRKQALRGAVLVSALAAAGALYAQVGKLTSEEAARRQGPPMGNAAPTIKPSADPRDFEGSYRAAQFAGGPGGGGGAGMGAGGAPGGAPGAGGPPGGAPAGGAPNGGAPGGGGGGGAPPGGEGFATPQGPYTSANCVPSNFTGWGGGPDGPTRILQTPKQLTLISEEQHMVRRIYIDQPHLKDFKGSYSGDSVARWDGNTLVVDTIGIKRIGAKDNDPMSRMTERITKQADGSLEDVATTYSGNSAQGNTRKSSLSWAGNQKVLEWICEDLGDVYYNDNIKL